MRLLVFADPHFHSWTNFGNDPTTGLSKRLVDQQEVTREITSIAIAEQVDGILCLGDIFHSVGNVTTEVLNTAYLFFTALRNAGFPVYFVPGNHDLNSRKNPKWYNYSCKIFNPSPPPANIKIIGYHEVIDYEATKGFDVVAIHKTPLNARLGGFVFEQGFDWQTLAANNKLVLCGHIHQRQHLSDYCIIVGAPMHLTFGDEGDRGIYLVNTSSGTAEFRKLQYPEFVTVENYSDTRDDGNYYRVLNDALSSDSLATENVKVQASPTYITERIKSTMFFEILKEWLTIQEKPTAYLDLLSDIVDEKFQLGKQLYPGRLCRVEAKDFLSLGDISYPVEDGFTLVLGLNDVFNSNGSGKSSLFEAIYWCLFGKTTKGLTGDDVVRNRPTKQRDCKVTLFLRAEDGSELHITRSRSEGIGIFKKSVEGTVYDISGERKLTDCQKLLEDLLGCDEKLFRTSCYFSQENLLMLTGLDDADRTKMITDLLGFESYNDLYTQAHKKIEKLNVSINQCVASRNRFQLEIATLRGKLVTYQESLATLHATCKEHQGKVLQAYDDEKQLKIELDNFKVAELPFRDFDAEELKLDILKTTHTGKLARLNLVANTQLSELQEAETQNKVALNEVVHAINSATDLEKELKIIASADEGAHCLKCGSLVSKEGKNAYIHCRQPELDLRKAARVLAEAEVTRLGGLVKHLKEVRADHLQDLSELEQAGLELNRQIIDLSKERRRYSDKLQEQASLRARLEARFTACTTRITECNTQLQTTIAQIKTVTNSITTLETSVATAEESIASLQQEVDSINAEIGILEFWKVAFSPKGIRALLLDKFCNEFNKVVNTYLHEISNDNMGLMITPTATTKGGEERNKIGMVVYFKDYEVKYASLSGGEKRRVDCSLIFGLSKYLEIKYNLGAQGLLGILILDEVFGGLDKSGEDTLVSLLDRESKHKAIFIIDHLLNLTGSADRIWTVGKTDDVSFLDTAFAV